MTITITRADADRILPQIIEEFGEDYTYPQRGPGFTLNSISCYYVWDGEPDCIIGKLLSRLGADANFLGKCDSVGSIRELVGADLVEVDDEYLLEALTTMQNTQDNGGTWGQAYRRYQDELPVLT